MLLAAGAMICSAAATILVLLERDHPRESGAGVQLVQGGDEGGQLDRIVGAVEDHRSAVWQGAAFEAAGEPDASQTMGGGLLVEGPPVPGGECGHGA